MGKSVLILGGMGYIGSQLYDFLHTHGFDCFSVDMGIFKPSTLHGIRPLPNLKMDYSKLKGDFIRQFDAVVLLAAHSSIPMCDLDSDGSQVNNVTNFERLCNKIGEKQTFIYASSAFVYNNALSNKETDELPPPICTYDRQKQEIDRYVHCLPNEWYGLRFGTVCGYSANPRNELMINSMTRSALLNGTVHVSSPESHRAVLGLVDLCRAVKHILDKNPESGYYNLASFNSNIRDLGEVIANHLDARLEVDPKVTSPYSLSLDTSKIISTGFEFIETAKLIAERSRMNDFSINRDWHVSYSNK